MMGASRLTIVGSSKIFALLAILSLGGYFQLWAKTLPASSNSTIFRADASSAKGAAGSGVQSDKPVNCEDVLLYL